MKIKNIVLFLQIHHEVGWWIILEDFEENKAEQLWKKGVPNDEGYFTLENSKVPKVMTAISPTSLELKGNSKKLPSSLTNC